MTPGVLLKIVGHELKHALHEAGPGVRASTPDENVESHGPAYDDEGPTSQPEDPPPSKDPEGF